MTNKVSYSPKALGDLDALWDYVSTELASPTNAESLIGRIMDRIDRISGFPELGTPLSAICDTRASYRFITEGDWMVFYRVADDRVYVDRILYGRSDYLKELLGRA